ncbi:acetyl-CoA carboxylase carboxyltransferase subunit alpha [Kineococcus indalonis]|uniref:acetyl-CoA carboxylase carboxyltransferase subunit alpha n=1 Tax=Kineococcus indalonis TaxID=2696566 RepID=UPI0014129181|nr:acetyl-CoA carboxylase carboxyltransferase subunit alpha [Kineococcus indalonis]NAZ84797.1 acetyl-CoA carboxylase carboxyltransferase subunit alpha [Kineococcus indalonis]
MTTTATPTTTGADWVKCAGCARPLYRRRLVRDLEVCHECGHHQRLSARDRIGQLTDPGSFEEFTLPPVPHDPLGFTDTAPYPQRLERARRATGEQEGTIVGTARVEGEPLVLLVMDFRFLGGSMGSATGEAVATAADEAVRRRLPLVLVTASGGARMQEGALSLMQMAKTSQALALVAEAGLLSVGVLTDPTFGGVTASFASLGQVLVAESGAAVGFAGKRVIQQTVPQELPKGFQQAEYLLAHGLVDRVESRERLRPLLGRLLRLHAGGPGRGARATGTVPAPRLPVPAAPAPDAWDVVRAARHPERPTTLDYLDLAFDDFVELHGDRAHGDDPAIVAGIASLAGRSVVVVGHQKGHDTRELVARNFGMPHPEGYRKALRLFEHAERSGLPVVTLVDTPGAYPGVAAEERGQSIAIAEAIARSSRLRVPVVSVVTGEGGSGGALALATGDRMLMLENAFFSVISPEGCAAILWRDAQEAAQAARALRVTAPDLVRLGVADGVVAEPAGGAHTDPEATAALVGRAVTEALDELCALDADELLRLRSARLRGMGAGRGSL